MVNVPSGELLHATWAETDSNAFYNALYANLYRSRGWYAELVDPAFTWNGAADGGSAATGY